MKILMFASGNSPHAKRPLDWLLNDGHEVTFSDWAYRGNFYPQGRENYRYVEFPRPRTMRGAWRLPDAIQSRLQRRSMNKQLRKIRRQAGADVVHLHQALPSAYPCIVADLKPLVLTIWGSEVNSLLEDGAPPNHRRIVGEILRAADVVIVDAPQMKEQCETLAGQPLKCEVLPLGIDLKLFRAGYEAEARSLRERLRIPPGTFVILSTRGLKPLYNQDLIVRAFAQARQNFQRPVVLLLKRYYQDEEYERELRKLISELKLDAHVVWMESVSHEELPVLYAAADAIVNFPRIDAMPVSLMEAAACERPVITADLPTYRDTFISRHMRTVPANQTQPLTDAFAEFVNGADKQHTTRVAAAKAEILREYDEKLCSERLVRLYQSLS